MCKKRKKDYRTFQEKFLDFMRNKPWKFILYSFIYALIILIFSILTKNKGGFLIVFNYPAAVGTYLIYFFEEKRGGTHFPFLVTIILLVLPLIAFIASLLGAEM